MDFWSGAASSAVQTLISLFHALTPASSDRSRWACSRELAAWCFIPCADWHWSLFCAFWKIAIGASLVLLVLVKEAFSILSFETVPLHRSQQKYWWYEDLVFVRGSYMCILAKLSDPLFSGEGSWGPWLLHCYGPRATEQHQYTVTRVPFFLREREISKKMFPLV